MILGSGLKQGPEGQRGAQAHSDDAPSSDVPAPPSGSIQTLVKNSWSPKHNKSNKPYHFIQINFYWFVYFFLQRNKDGLNDPFAENTVKGESEAELGEVSH